MVECVAGALAANYGRNTFCELGLRDAVVAVVRPHNVAAAHGHVADSSTSQTVMLDSYTHGRDLA